ncbi:protein EFR3 homolog B-like [Labrus mixtus]|uniref:protein EFR3 homolog B-like n=1 Tax=Labrus mixtus TaxID=508554 RepID=UPI0029C005B1|nr:protein EFR3 homolog B-like [Labrus mixtus]
MCELGRLKSIESLTCELVCVEDRGSVEEEERRRMQLVEKFQTAPFEEIAAHCGARTSLLQSKLDEVVDLIMRPVTCSRAPRRSTDSRSFYPIGATL